MGGIVAANVTVVTCLVVSRHAPCAHLRPVTIVTARVVTTAVALGVVMMSGTMSGAFVSVTDRVEIAMSANVIVIVIATESAIDTRVRVRARAR
jgi:hypothetical protein